VYCCPGSPLQGDFLKAMSTKTSSSKQGPEILPFEADQPSPNRNPSSVPAIRFRFILPFIYQTSDQSSPSAQPWLRASVNRTIRLGAVRLSQAPTRSALPLCLECYDKFPISLLEFELHDLKPEIRRQAYRPFYTRLGANSMPPLPVSHALRPTAMISTSRS